MNAFSLILILAQVCVILWLVVQLLKLGARFGEMRGTLRPQEQALLGRVNLIEQRLDNLETLLVAQAERRHYDRAS